MIEEEVKVKEEEVAVSKISVSRLVTFDKEVVEETEQANTEIT